ncbi:hypothetical protein M409DRAFT_20622 [Zasmidium cellare ATCC 36951]|uniref:Heterokaryon incompatibility domain-containing protein n=1 Tax=Zasmidium cellare ATCC 36951 TaxID=1080233 RepID=A0A6A6CRS9_ZASCE|nr:uncharacterized protein M409DRAFT_20622 [Zasmidium cellare ATCC 36951]KAF2169403.1 hypothetical protein M409DRAFT_20622 [Zasmidium cellare ATCC 36951]
MAPDDLCEACMAVFADGSFGRYALSDCNVVDSEDDDPEDDDPESPGNGAVSIFAFPVENFGNNAQLIHLGELSLSSENTGSKEVVQMAKGLLQHCLERHNLCADESGPDWRPRRLLALDGSFAKLVETTGRDLTDPYATLSHCWGGTPSFVLTSQNMSEFQRGLAFSQFDATFYDAMITAQKLGIHYIWIDCYCIVQGQGEASLRDWKEQSVLMHKVYSNGIVNIGAAHGVDSRAGLFVSRERWRDLHYPLAAVSHQVGVIVVYCTAEH